MTSRFPTGFALGKSHGRRGTGMKNPIHPSSRQCTDTVQCWWWSLSSSWVNTVEMMMLSMMGILMMTSTKGRVIMEMTNVARGRQILFTGGWNPTQQPCSWQQTHCIALGKYVFLQLSNTSQICTIFVDYLHWQTNQPCWKQTQLVDMNMASVNMSGTFTCDYQVLLK